MKLWKIVISFIRNEEKITYVETLFLYTRYVVSIELYAILKETRVNQNIQYTIDVF